MPNPSLQAAFNDSPLFAGLTPEAQVLRFEDGQSLSNRADQEESVGLVLRGLADVWCIATDGTETLLNTARQGDCFGIAYVFETTGMQTRVVARGRCEAAFVRRAVIRDLLWNDPDFALRYHELCNRKMQFLLGRIALLTAQSCRTRLAAYLLLNRDADGFIPMRGTKDELASRLSVSRAAVYRELNRLQERGLIEQIRHGVRLADPNALKRQMFDDRGLSKDGSPSDKNQPKEK